MRWWHFTLAAVALMAPLGSSAATIGLSPTKVSVEEGKSVTLRVFVSSAQAVNAVSGTITYPPDLLAVTSLSKSSSALSLWVQEPSSANGEITFSGVAPNPGFSGDNQRALTITLRARKPGLATLVFSSAQVLANDGNGTDILQSKYGATIAISAASAEPPAQPQKAAQTATSAAQVKEISSQRALAQQWQGSPLLLFLATGCVPLWLFLMFALVSDLLIMYLLMRVYWLDRKHKQNP